jgi:hypothetical protein
VRQVPLAEVAAVVKAVGLEATCRDRGPPRAPE